VSLRILEIGSYIAPAYAGMILAEQGHVVAKWTSTTPDPMLGLNRGGELWEWINFGKVVYTRPAKSITELETGVFDAVIDNIRLSTWQSWGVDPTEQADRLGVPWVSLRDDFDGRSFDAIAQARAWGDHLGYLPVYLGDTAAGLWLAFKVLAAPPGHHVLRQAASLAKLVEGELVVTGKRTGREEPLWDEPGTYGEDEGTTRVIFKGETVRESFRDDDWRRSNLRHVDGRYVI
jgi:hypothetical protein